MKPQGLGLIDCIYADYCKITCNAYRGGMSIRIGSGAEDDPFRVFSTPSGIQKEDMIGNDVFELDMDQKVVSMPVTPGLKLSSMTNIWYSVYNLRPSAMCVIHTHSLNAQLATLLEQDNSGDGETTHCLRITHLEMIKGVGNHAYDSMLEIPIIDNQRSENLLAPDFEKAIQKYPKCNAVLVRRHGVYVWGDSWEEAKTKLESFDYLFESAVKMKSMGIDCGIVPGTNSSSNKRKRIE
jgi:methylthioribulose 1-phosphate dehydratase/enolase-phosphatase E1